MSKFLIIGIAIFVALRFGYPVYQDSQFRDELRLKMQKQSSPTSPDPAAIEITLENNYPIQTMKMRLVEMNTSDISEEKLKKFDEIPEQVICRNLQVFEKNSPYHIKNLLQVFEEDNYTVKFIITDKENKVIKEHTQRILDCPSAKRLKAISQ